MSDADTWSGFSNAVVRLSMPGGDRRLEPQPVGVVGDFSFAAPVHIITAFNPAGIEADAAANEASHALLAASLRSYESFASIGSTPDETLAEPGFAVLDLPETDAIELGRRYGQLAIYRWDRHALEIVGIDDGRRHRMGWALVDLP